MCNLLKLAEDFASLFYDSKMERVIHLKDHLIYAMMGFFIINDSMAEMIFL